MQLYVILRRGAWEDAPDLEAAAAESTRVANEEMDGRVKWIRSYVIEEEDGTISYWALRHAAGKPDFHHPDGFAMELA